VQINRITVLDFSSNESVKEALEYYRLALNILCVTQFVTINVR